MHQNTAFEKRSKLNNPVKNLNDNSLPSIQTFINVKKKKTELTNMNIYVYPILF